MMKQLLLLCIAAGAFGCGSSAELTPDQLSKIDAHLQPVLQGGIPTRDGCTASVDEVGITRYRVIIRGNADDIRDAGISVETMLGDILTANVGVEQIRSLAKLASVKSIECGSKNFPQ
jgi:hypothetical protein